MELHGKFCDKKYGRLAQKHRKFSVDETVLNDLMTRYLSGGSPVLEGKPRKGRTPSVGRSQRRLSECKVFYHRKSSKDSMDDSTSSSGKQTRANSITKLGSQISAIIGLTPQVIRGGGGELLLITNFLHPNI